MSPTRRDLLKASAGTVAAALAGIPATARVAALPETTGELVTIVSCALAGFTFVLSDGSFLAVVAHDDLNPADGAYPHSMLSISRSGPDIAEREGSCFLSERDAGWLCAQLRGMGRGYLRDYNEWKAKNGS